MIVALALETGLAALWLGSYLFTNLVLSPALEKAVADGASRTAIRSVVGRRYGALAAPVLIAWLVAILAQPLDGGTVARAALLVLLLVAVGLHGYLLGGRMQALAKRQLAGAAGGAPEPGSRKDLEARQAGLRRASARLTVASLVLSLALALWAVALVARA